MQAFEKFCSGFDEFQFGEIMGVIQIYEKLYRTSIWEKNLIPLWIRVHGIMVTIVRPDEDVYEEVYGVASGVSGSFIGSLKALVFGDDWQPTDLRNIGTFDKGWMYCNVSDMSGSNFVIQVGDVIEFSGSTIGRQDNKVRRYKIDELDAVGSTIQIVQRFRLSSIGD